MTFFPNYRPPTGGVAETNWYIEAAAPTGVDDTTALQATHDSALALGARVQLRPGVYNLVSVGGSVRRCISITGSSTKVRWSGSGTTIRFDSRDTYAIHVDAGATDVSFDGIFFQGYTGTGDSDKTINNKAALYVVDGVVDVHVTGCHFDHVQTAFFVSGDDSNRLTFTNNTVVDAPLALNPPSYAIITNNFFQDVECYVDPVGGIGHSRSHAVYCFGRCQYLVLTGNYFKNQSSATVEIRANDAPLLQKRAWIISDNVFEHTSPLYGLYISSLGSEINIGSCIISGNIFRNSGGPMQLTGLRDAIITDNVMEFDYQYDFAPGSTGITLTSAFDSGETCVSKGCIISNNRIVNRHPFWAKVTISSLPAQGDTITVGAVTYTWHNTANLSGQIQIGASIDDCGNNLMSSLQGKSFTLQNKVLRDNTDCWKTFNATPTEVWVASLKTFALSETGTAVTVSAVTDATGVLVTGIDVSNAIDTKIHGNSITGCKGWNINSCVAPVVYNNSVSDPYDGIGGIGRGNAWPVYDTNHFNWNRRYLTPGITSNQQLISYDAFPIIRNCGILAEQSGGASIHTLPWMTGQSGVVPVGDGHARQIFFYGREVSTAAPGARDFHWEDGDEILIYNNLSTVVHTFVFKRTGPVEASKEFNSYAGLIACINNQTSGSWTASNPVSAYYGSDGQAYGYILLVAGTAGTTRNGDEVEINQDKNGRTGPQACGVYLKPWVTGGVYNNRNQAEFLGGAAQATKTAVFTPLASTVSAIHVAGVDEASHALLPRVYQADILPGVGFVITHGVASGTEKFFWSIS